MQFYRNFATVSTAIAIAWQGRCICFCALQGLQEPHMLMPGHEFVTVKGEDLVSHSDLRSRFFDLILAADVIEHVSNLGSFLDACASLLSPGGKRVITTPAAFSLKRFAFLALTGREHVHPDHVAYFSASTLSQILGRSGLDIESIHGFQWGNPSWKNRIANLVCAPFL